MNWAAPDFAWLLLLLVPAAALLHWSAARRQRDLRLLLEKDAPSHSRPQAIRRRLALATAAFLLIVAALCQPQWGEVYMQRQDKSRDILIALDVSRSMLADDLQPNRLTLAKTAIAKWLPRLRGDRVGLIAFAGSAFMVCPPTSDYSTFADVLAESGPDLLPLGGTSLANALREAKRALAVTHGKSLIVISDGEDHGGEALATATALHKAGVSVHVVAVGTDSGGLIPLPGGEFHKDRQGNLVHSRLNGEMLRALAQAGGGRLFNLATQPDALETLHALALISQEKHDRREMRRQLAERFQLPLAMALLLLASESLLAMRRPT